MASNTLWMQKAFAHNKGGLHRATHTPEGEKIPKKKIYRAAHSKNSHVQHMAQAALNASKSRKHYGSG
jgi:hypothetical protein